MNAEVPIRADYRIIQQILSSSLSGKVEHDPKEYQKIVGAFKVAGGSWEKVFKGSVDDIVLLKDLIKKAFDAGDLTKKHDWEDL